jgi:hypothetical protein
MLSDYQLDRKIWHESAKPDIRPPFKPWLFQENSVTMGQCHAITSNNILDALAMFDVFCAHSLHPKSTSNPQLQSYYVCLQNAIEKEFQSISEGNVVESYPQCMEPWLWRTSLGYFQHNDSDDQEIHRYNQGGLIFVTRFAHYCVFWFYCSHTVLTSDLVSLVEGV